MIGMAVAPMYSPRFLIVFLACWVPCQTDRGDSFGQEVTAGAKHG